MFAKACRFYGWTPAVIRNEVPSVIHDYIGWMDRVEKEEAQLKLVISTAPHTKESDQKKLQGQLKVKPFKIKKRKMSLERIEEGMCIQKWLDERNK